MINNIIQFNRLTKLKEIHFKEIDNTNSPEEKKEIKFLDASDETSSYRPSSSSSSSEKDKLPDKVISDNRKSLILAHVKTRQLEISRHKSQIIRRSSSVNVNP